jgi:hypothetical protein
MSIVGDGQVSAYQEKLKQLEERQADLLADNLELKELCLFLDQERNQVSSGHYLLQSMEITQLTHTHTHTKHTGFLSIFTGN